MWLKIVELSVRNLMLNKLRSLLTMLGTILGVSSVIAMLAIGEGSKRRAVEQIRQLGAANVIVRSVKPGDDDSRDAASSGGGQRQVSRVAEYGLKYSDYDVLAARDTLPTVKQVVPVSLVRKNAQYGRHRISNARILGTTPDYQSIKRLTLRRGRFLTAMDDATMANVAVLAAGAAERLFSYEDPIGKPLLLGEGAYVVVGVLQSQDSGGAVPGAIGAQDMNNDIYIPLNSARSRFGELQLILRSGGRDFERTQLSEITLTLHDETLVTATASMVRRLLLQRHPNKVDFEIQVPLELLRQAEREKRIWNLVLGSIAGISLLVGGIGIMNIMLATVSERTKEIGIRRALGATRTHIVTQFMVESMVLSSGGGLMGIFLGVAIPLTVSHFSEIETALSWWAVIIAFSTSVLTGVVFGVYPARRAALMNPIEALRHE
jgi:putative ABC transport system permease protein